MTRAQKDKKPRRLRSALKFVCPLLSVSSTAFSALICLSRGRRISILSESISMPMKSTTVPSSDLLVFSVKPR